MIIWDNNVLQYTLAGDIILAPADKVLDLTVLHLYLLSEHTILALQLVLLCFLMSHVVPLLPDAILKHILSHFRNE